MPRAGTLGRAARLLSLLALPACAAGPETSLPPAPLLEPALRIPGEYARGELGFRFGPPRDVDGDGIADIAAGARFTDFESTQMGCAGVWSSAGGRRIAHWKGSIPDALFGNAVILGPDADGDGFPDLVASAPNGRVGGVYRGVLTAHSPRSGRTLWTFTGETGENLGWHLALAGDQDRDGVEDLFAGAPLASGISKVYLIGGRDGKVLRRYDSPQTGDNFGWCVSALSDLDGDALPDLLVGAPSARQGSITVGAAYAIPAAGGGPIHSWFGREENGEFGQYVCGLDDLDGDGVGEAAVGTPRRQAPGSAERFAGEVDIYSGRSGARIFRFVSGQPGELYGRALAAAGDLDADGLPDIAIGAPWWSAAGMERAGRFEVRSGRTGSVIFEARGDRPDGWLGWHIEAGAALGPERRRGLVVSALLSAEGSKPAAGALLLYLRPDGKPR